jgi:type I restriction enzyme S subunit
LSGGTPSTAIAEYWNGDIPWVSAKDVGGAAGSFLLETEKTISQLGVDNSSTKVLPAFTTIITARGTVGGYCLLGKAMAMNQTNYGLRAKKGVGDYFVFFSTAEMIDYLRQQAYGTIFDTITTKTFRDTITVQPPQNLLGKFEETVRPIMTRILSGERESRTLAALRDALLPKLLSGEVRVGGLDREGAK